MRIAQLQPVTPPQKTAPEVLPWLSWSCLLLTGWIVLFPLAYTWDNQPTYAFGWWVPLLAVILGSERWATRPDPEPTNSPTRLGWFFLGWGTLFFCLRMALEVSLASRQFLAGCTFLYLGALFYWLWIYGGARWVRHFGFPIFFLLLCVPWPTQIEIPVVQGLEHFNAWMVAQALVIFFAISAEATGNVIILPHDVLGVQDACSGIRSLQAAIMIGFLLGELYRFEWPRRGRIVLLAVALALIGNFVRTLFLALVANANGVAVMSQWHDTAGTFILAFTSMTTWLVCHMLRRFDDPPAPLERRASRPAGGEASFMAQRLALGILCMAALVHLSTWGWYSWRDRGAARYPTWTALSPASGKFQAMDIDKETSDLLRYSAGREVKWQGSQGWNWIAYWFRYHPNPWGTAVFQNHNPDACLPPAGFNKVADYDPFVAQVHDVQLHVWPKEFSHRGTPVYVFWVVYADRSNFPLEQAVMGPREGYGTKLSQYLSSIWSGTRGSGAEMESLETFLTGPHDFATAKTAFLNELPGMIVPDDRPPPSLAGTVQSP